MWGLPGQRGGTPLTLGGVILCQRAVMRWGGGYGVGGRSNAIKQGAHCVDRAWATCRFGHKNRLVLGSGFYSRGRSAMRRLRPHDRFQGMPQAVRRKAGLACTLDKGCRVQLQTKRADHPQNCRKLGISGWRQGFVQTLSSKTRLTRELRHTLGAGDITQRRREKRGIAFFERCLKIGRHIFIGLKMFGWIPDTASDQAIDAEQLRLLDMRGRAF